MEYIYNGNGQRADKLIPSQNKCTVFHYDQNGLLITESTRTGNIKAEYVYLNGSPLAKIENNNIYYYHNDHLGTPMVMTDSSGSVVWQGEYLPFGEALSVSGTITNNLRFPGQYYDAETGLNYNWFRYYDSKLGRYPQADPIGLLGGVNLFTYVRNSPCNWADPWGLASLTTYMHETSGITVFDPTPEDPDGVPFAIRTRNKVDSTAKKGANNPYSTEDIIGCLQVKDKKYGENAYIKTGDKRGRDIHGGGSSLKNPYWPRQGWKPTMGCTRGQNADIQEMCEIINDFKKRHPNVKIPYNRVKGVPTLRYD